MVKKMNDNCKKEKEIEVNFEKDIKVINILLKILIALVLFFIIQLFYVIF